MYRTLRNIHIYEGLHTAAYILTAKASRLLDRADAGTGNFELCVVEAWHCLKQAAGMLTEASQMDLGGKYV